MRLPAWILAALLGTALDLPAQDGGKLAWKGKGPDTPKAAMAEARRAGKPILFFFTSHG